MSEASTKKPVSIPRGALRVVLFGMPDAGKSSLLGALAQASETQERSLHGKLIDESQGLIELQNRLYAGTPKQTLEELAPFPVRLEPYPAEAGARAPAPLDAVLIDCDGRRANEYLSRQRDLDAADTPLGKAVLDADTLLLLVDASATQEVIRRDFAQFGRFLRLLEQNRGRRTEVGGLPVYLVLTKCDLLARKTDTAVTWMERIEEHKRTVDRKFREYLAQQGPGQDSPFGKVELHLWATAVKRPALGETPAKPRDPYGVGELFRQALDSAGAYRVQQARAGRMLRLTVAGVLGSVALLILLGLFFWASRESPEVAQLIETIDRFRSAHGTPAERFADPDKTVKELQGFEQDPVFPEMPPEKKEYVEDYLKELKAFQEYRKELEDVQRPEFVRSDAQLQHLLAILDKVQPPPQYAEDWQQTKLGKQRQRWRKDAETLRREVNKAEGKLKDLLARRARLRTEALTEAQRRQKIEEILKEGEDMPYRDENKDRLLPGSRDLTYENVLQFDRVAGLYREWKTVRQELKAT